MNINALRKQLNDIKRVSDTSDNCILVYNLVYDDNTTLWSFNIPTTKKIANSVIENAKNKSIAHIY